MGAGGNGNGPPHHQQSPRMNRTTKSQRTARAWQRELLRTRLAAVFTILSLLDQLHQTTVTAAAQGLRSSKPRFFPMASTRTRRYSSSTFTCFSLMHVLAQAKDCRLRGLLHSLLDMPGSNGTQSGFKPSRQGSITKLGGMCRAVPNSVGGQ